MNNQDFTATFSVDQTPEQVFAAINDVRSWWTGEIEGRTDTLGAEFTYRYKDIHRTTHKITELVPGKRVVWHVTASHLSLVREQAASGTGPTSSSTSRARATGPRCASRTSASRRPSSATIGCSRAWSFFITDSLKKRIATGNGRAERGVAARRVRRVIHGRVHADGARGRGRPRRAARQGGGRAHREARRVRGRAAPRGAS